MAAELKPREMTAKQRKFAEAFAVHRNGARAYREVYGRNINENTAYSCAWKLLRKAKVYELVKAREEDALIRNGISQDMIIQEWKSIAFSDVTGVTNASLDHLDQLPVNVRRAIKKVKHVITQFGETTEIELYSKISALEKLSEIAGLTKERETNITLNQQNNTTVNEITVRVIRPNEAT
jgi:uncharacterized protein (UPF0147 family)